MLKMQDSGKGADVAGMRVAKLSLRLKDKKVIAMLAEMI